MIIQSPVLTDEKMERLLVDPHITVREALKRMDSGGEKILIVIDENNKLLGTITDGDIRRWILKEGELQSSIAELYNRNPKTVTENYDLAKVRKIMLTQRVDLVPVVRPNKEIVTFLFRDDVFENKVKAKPKLLDAPVLVMAGGKGARLDPFTRILPKPLIPVGDKPIIEIIMDHFSEFGCSNFFLTLNYKGKMIQSYFETTENPYQINLIWEEQPRGTAGSLVEASHKIEAPSFFVTNCDILVKADYVDVFAFHQKNKADITIVGSVQHLSVPYGVLKVKRGGKLQNIVEKPEYSFLVNTGMYVIKKEIVEHIPTNRAVDFPELISIVKEQGGKVLVYPVSQLSWIDIGQWHEYQEAVKKIQPLTSP